jgi:tetratricopeptide (TPR) repeat protein
MGEDRPKPPAEWLRHLHEAGQWQRLVEVAIQSLAVDPNDQPTHRHVAWAYAKMGKANAMAPHVEFLLRADADEPSNHHLAAIYHLELKQSAKAKVHIDRLLAKSPQDATYHYLACIHALRTNQVLAAQHHIRLARQHSPEWAAAAHLEVKIAALNETKAHEAWDRIRRLEQTLSLDPEDEDVMASIGDVYLDELEQPREAERFYRSALAIDPMDPALQKKLLNAVRARSLLYRTLLMPLVAARGINGFFHRGGVRFLLFILLFKVVIAFLIWLLIIGAIFFPAAKVYEWLVLSDVTRSRWQFRLWQPLVKLLQAPLWQRLVVTLGLIFIAWVLVASKVSGRSLLQAAEFMACVFGVHFVGLLVWVGFRKMRSAYGKWWHARRQKRELAPPPLPEKAAEGV